MNIVFLVMDTARADYIGEYINGNPVTPNIDQIAKTGVRFDNVYSSAPWTLPSHASLFTGQYSSEHGTHAAHNSLDPSIPTIIDLFNSVGYETVGCSNNAWISSSFGFTKGFDRFFKGWLLFQSENDLGDIGLASHGDDRIKKGVEKLFQNNTIKTLGNFAYSKFLTEYQYDDGAKRTNNWIRNWLAKRDSSRPFFLFANYLEPHLEYRPPDSYAEKFLPEDVPLSRAKDIPQNAWKYITQQIALSDEEFEILRGLYAASIAYLDSRIGDLRDMFKEAGEWEETLFVIVGDHGENIGHHDLMDHQYCLYDSLLHVPAIAQGGPFTGGRTNDQLLQVLDFVPTVAEVAGLDISELEAPNAIAIQANKNRDYVFGEYMAPQPSKEALLNDVGDPHSIFDKYDRALRAVRTENYKLIQGSDGSIELFDIQADPQEQENIEDNQPRKAEELIEILETELDTFEKPIGDNQETVEDEAVKSRLSDLGYM